jgi:hypothetical protein
MPVRNPKVSPLTVLASADTESNDLDLNMICFLKEGGNIAVERSSTVAEVSNNFLGVYPWFFASSTKTTTKPMIAMTPRRGSMPPKAMAKPVAKIDTNDEICNNIFGFLSFSFLNLLRRNRSFLLRKQRRKSISVN